MNNRYEDIVEIVEVGDTERVNLYLANDYQLLAISGVSYARKYPDDASQAKRGEYFVRRAVTYTLGRGTDVVHYDPPEREKRQKGGAA